MAASSGPAAIVEPIPVQDIPISDIEFMDFGDASTRVVLLVDGVIFEAECQPVRKVVGSVTFEVTRLMPFVWKALRYLAKKGMTAVADTVGIDPPGPRPLH